VKGWIEVTGRTCGYRILIQVSAIDSTEEDYQRVIIACLDRRYDVLETYETLKQRISEAGE